MAIMMPAPATTSTPWQSAMPAIVPAQGPPQFRDEAAFDANVLASALIVDDDRTNTVAVALDGGDAVVGQVWAP